MRDSDRREQKWEIARGGCKRTDLGEDALGRVKLVATDNDLLPVVEASKGFNLGSDTGAHAFVSGKLEYMPASGGDGREDQPICLDVVKVDADGAVRDAGDGTLRVDSSGPSFVTHDADARGEEVARVRVRLEADEVAAEHAVQDRFAAWFMSIMGSVFLCQGG